jgi:phosphatidylglycerophosphate synthase
MAEYQPVSRRPIADGFRATARWATALCVKRGIHPDTISYASMIVSAAAGLCFWKAGRIPVLLLIAPLLCYVRLWFNMLDGMVAVAADKASARGEILNDLPDRASDVMIFAGVAHGGLMNPILGYWTVIFALLVAYAGLVGQAVNGRREFGGIMSKPWRMVTLHLGAWTTFIVLKTNNGGAQLGGLAILDWTCLAIMVGCLQTIYLRLKRIMIALGNK